MGERAKKIDKLADALERMWSGGGDYSVYTVAIYREEVRHLLHELLDARPLPSGEGK